MSEIERELNRLASTTQRGAAAAANIYAGTTGLEVVGALNVAAGISTVTGPTYPLDENGNMILDEDGFPIVAEQSETIDARREMAGVCNALAGTTGLEALAALKRVS